MRVTFKNFRCLRDTSIDFTPLTVIVGPNASGKSSILDALNPDLDLSAQDVWQRRPGLAVEIRREYDSGGVAVRSFAESYGQNGSISGMPPSYQVLRFDTDALRRSNQLWTAATLVKDGGNLTNVFATLDRKTQADVARSFCSLVPVFSDVNAKPYAQGHARLVFNDRWNTSVEYAPEQVSDGSMLVLAFLMLRYQSPAPSVLAIEELERGIHPYLIRELIAFVRQLAKGEFGGTKMHIVIATQSPEVLEFIEPEEMRVLKRQEDGSVTIETLSSGSEHWRAAFEEYSRSLGRVWLSGGIGGVPG